MYGGNSKTYGYFDNNQTNSQPAQPTMSQTHINISNVPGNHNPASNPPSSSSAPGSNKTPLPTVTTTNAQSRNTSDARPLTQVQSDASYLTKVAHIDDPEVQVLDLKQSQSFQDSRNNGLSSKRRRESEAKPDILINKESQLNDGNEDSKHSKKQSRSVTVFQCKSCRHIISDTLSWRGAVDDEELKVFVVSSIVPESVKTTSQLTMSQSGLDRGSSYNDLVCAKCDHLLGRIYMTTTQHMDFARGMYTFMAEEMAYYLCGSHKQAEPGIDDAIKAMLKPTPSTTSKQLAMVETMLMSIHKQFQELNERVARIESATK